MVAQTVNNTRVTQAVPFFGVTDLEHSLRFYVDGLGFRVTKEWVPDGRRRWCWLEHGEAALMLQEFWSEGQHTNVPTEKLGVGVNTCFLCEDALGVYREAKSHGVQGTLPQVGNAMWVTTFIDPDGYRLDFTSFTDAPEESVYSE